LIVDIIDGLVRHPSTHLRTAIQTRPVSVFDNDAKNKFFSIFD
jgi:hypothetical protein